MRVEVFEDSFVRRLDPITLGRPAYSIQCGGFCLADWLAELKFPVSAIVRSHLSAWQSAEYPSFEASSDGTSPRVLVNARLVPCESAFTTLRQISLSKRPGIVFHGPSIAAALLPGVTPELCEPYDPGRMSEFLRHPQIASLPVLDYRLPLLDFPHDVIRFHSETLADNLTWRIQSRAYREVRDDMFIAANVELPTWIDVETKKGPIVVESGCVIRPFTTLRGPLYLGRMSQVNDHAILKPGVAIGAMSKVGGEVESSVIEACSNKQHTGYLGHAYLGRWVNLGAGTSNSNLKNTYGTVRV